jgi:FdhE protein
MMAPGSPLDGLKRQRPEWAPWLAVVEEILREIGTAEWDAAVPADASSSADASGAKAAAGQPAIPLLAGVTLRLQSSSVRRLLQRLIRVAALSGTPKMATLEPWLQAEPDVLALFKASLCQDSDRINDVAAARGADAEALQAVLGLLPMPFLQACNRRWASSISESWIDGYCPLCGSWPAFAEVRGIERSRHFRCGRCGGAWHARALHCPYCDLTDHDALVSLVPEKGHSHGVIEACTRCHGYVKTFTRLQGCPPATVLVDDLASVDLDVAACAEGYMRPPGAGYALDVTVIDTSARRRLFAWNA